jgi:hypothetical protein
LVAHDGSVGGAITGFVSALGLGKILGFITLTSVWQTLALGAIGAIGGYLGKMLIVYLVKLIKAKINQ